MSKVQYNEHIAALKGSELHHDLKNRPGEDGDPNHADAASEPAGKEMDEAIAESSADTAMAEDLKDQAMSES